MPINTPYSVNELPDNNNNFLRWFKAGSGSYVPLPSVYRVACENYKPALVPGQLFSFFFNIESPDIASIMADWVVTIVDANDNILADAVTSLQWVQDTDTSNYRFYESFTVPSLDDKSLVYLLINNNITGDVQYKSNAFKIKNDWQETLVKTRYRNTTDVRSFQYEDLPAYENTFFLDISLFGVEAGISEGGTYTSTTTGRTRNWGIESFKAKKFRTVRFDEPAHDAAFAMTSLHDEVYFNDMRFTPVNSEPYAYNWEAELTISHGEFLAYEYNFADDLKGNNL